MSKETKIAASILAADLSKTGKEIKAVDRAGIDFIHIDVMDGHFVDNITFGADFIRSIRKSSDKTFDVHLMIDNVDKYAKALISAGADIITFHAENHKKPQSVINLIKAYGCRVGLAIKPDTKVSSIKKFLPYIDLILVMSVEPGFSGQKYISQEKKVAEIVKLVKDKPIEIEVDGGINPNNSEKLIKAGATILVAGSYIFESKNYKKAIKNLRG